MYIDILQLYPLIQFEINIPGFYKLYGCDCIAIILFSVVRIF